MVFHCLRCNAQIKSSHKQFYCSRTCYWLAMKMDVPARNCKQCGVSFTPPGKQRNRTFCSTACYGQFNRGENHGQYTGSVSLGKTGYYFYRSSHPVHPNKSVHWVIWHEKYPNASCADCGGAVQHVHHIDENPINNELENLIGLCALCHSRRHQEMDRQRGKPGRGRSGVRNIIWNEYHNCYEVKLVVRKQKIALGRFLTVEAAKAALETYHQTKCS